MKQASRGGKYYRCEKCGEHVQQEKWKWNWTIYRKHKGCGGQLTEHHPTRPSDEFFVKHFRIGSYREYLKSDLWYSIRERVFKRDKKLCMICRKRASQVHHKSYHPKVMRGEDLRPLVSVCRPCHEKIEYDERGKKQSLGGANERLEFFRPSGKPPIKPVVECGCGAKRRRRVIEQDAERYYCMGCGAYLGKTPRSKPRAIILSTRTKKKLRWKRGRRRKARTGK